MVQEDEFHRKPTVEEVEFARQNGYSGLKIHTRERQSHSNMVEGRAIIEAAERNSKLMQDISWKAKSNKKSMKKQSPHNSKSQSTLSRADMKKFFDSK